MAHFVCLIQEGQAAHNATTELEAGLHAVYARHFEEEATTVDWRPIPPGCMFTEGKPSTTSIITPRVAGPTTREEREAFMREICDLWEHATGCSHNEVLVAMTEIPSGSD